MITWNEWVAQEHPELMSELKVFGHEIDLKKAAQAATLGASLIAGSMLPPHSIAQGDEALPFTQHIQTQGAFDPTFGPQPPKYGSKVNTPMEIWKYQFRWVQEQEANMRRGRRPSPEYIAFVQRYNNQFPKAPAH